MITILLVSLNTRLKSRGDWPFILSPLIKFGTASQFKLELPLCPQIMFGGLHTRDLVYVVEVSLVKVNVVCEVSDEFGLTLNNTCDCTVAIVARSPSAVVW